jgi:putative transposase
MRKRGVDAIYRKPNTSRRHEGNHVCPYLLRDLRIVRSNQVWGTDITYIPLCRGFAYLIAVLDWFSRRMLSWRLSSKLPTDFCLDAVEEAIERHGLLEIFNIGQCSQFADSEFTGLLKANGIRISMDAKNCWRDNVFMERLWRTVKYEQVYLHAYSSMDDAKTHLKEYLQFYSSMRPHQSLDDRTPNAIYFEDAGAEKHAA